MSQQPRRRGTRVPDARQRLGVAARGEARCVESTYAGCAWDTHSLDVVIARSSCDEAIQKWIPGKILDCFAEPVIGPRFARTRFAPMLPASTAVRPAYCDDRDTPLSVGPE